jgi:hypothetical protein
MLLCQQHERTSVGLTDGSLMCSLASGQVTEWSCHLTTARRNENGGQKLRNWKKNVKHYQIIMVYLFVVYLTLSKDYTASNDAE